MSQERPASHVFHRAARREFPVIDRGCGASLWDRDGRKYLDGSGGAVVVNIGHGGVEVVADKATRRPFPRAERRAERLAARAFRAGLVTYPSGGCLGTEGDVVMLAPPFVVTEEELSEMAKILDESLTAEGL